MKKMKLKQNSTLLENRRNQETGHRTLTILITNIRRNIPNIQQTTNMNRNIRNNPIVQQSTSRLYKSRDETGDIKFKIGDSEISAHKCMLAALSPKFNRQFYGDFDDKNSQVIEVNEPCISAAAFEEYLQFYYLDKVTLTDEHIEGVIFLAKASLVHEFYIECTKFLNENLSIENVCQTYHLANLHECNDLLKVCENKIQTKMKEVFETQGFISCDRSMLFKILQLVPSSCKAADVFEACISWAKHFCMENHLNAGSNGDIREALGDILYQIRFGTMSIEEFMKYYGSFKSLFTDDERDEIFCMIGKVSNFKSKRFVENETWDEKFSIECNRISAETSSSILTDGSSITSFSCNRRILLGALYFGPFSRFDHLRNLSIIVTVTEKEMSSTQHTNIFRKRVESSVFRSDQQSCFKLQPPIAIKSNHVYDIILWLSHPVTLKILEYRNEIVLDNNTTVKFYDTDGPVTGLRVMI